ncbi:8757_t:CDS:2, partial [Dentiscutata erythropus]
RLLISMNIKDEDIQDPLERLKLIVDFYRVDFNMIEKRDIGALLASLKLKQYAPNFVKLDWDEAINMRYYELEELGINSYVARQTIYKKFQDIKSAIAETRGSRRPYEADVSKKETTEQFEYDELEDEKYNVRYM